MNILLLLYVVLMPFMSALAPSVWMPLPLIFLLLVSPILLMKHRGPALLSAMRRDLGFMLMLALGFLAMPFSPLPLGSKTFNYSVALIVCYLSFFVLVRLLLTQPRVRWSDVSTASHVALTVLSVAIIFEFYLASFHGVFFADIIPFAHDNLNIADLLTDSFKRPRAFSMEPGFTALAFECLWPLALADFGTRRRGVWRHALYATAFLLLASAAAIVCLMAAAAVVWAIRVRDWKGLLRFAAAFTLVLVPLSLSGDGRDLLWSVVGRKLDIVSLDVSEGSDGVTALVRLVTYETGFSFVKAFPGGVGWGGIGQAFFQGVALPVDAALMGSGMLSLYLDIAVASGVLGLVAFLWFVGLRIHGALSSRRPYAVFVSCALISVCFHHVFITEFQFPFFWFLLALADKLVFEREPVAAHDKGAQRRFRKARRGAPVVSTAPGASPALAVFGPHPDAANPLKA